ncbi:unnamed protein product [Calypogeia fissa]
MWEGLLYKIRQLNDAEGWAIGGIASESTGTRPISLEQFLAVLSGVIIDIVDNGDNGCGATLLCSPKSNRRRSQW